MDQVSNLPVRSHPSPFWMELFDHSRPFVSSSNGLRKYFIGLVKYNDQRERERIIFQWTVPSIKFFPKYLIMKKYFCDRINIGILLLLLLYKKKRQEFLTDKLFQNHGWINKPGDSRKLAEILTFGAWHAMRDERFYISISCKIYWDVK